MASLPPPAGCGDAAAGREASNPLNTLLRRFDGFFKARQIAVKVFI